jgi:hypothetical protein
VLLSLASHNDDLKRLLEKGYAIKFDSSHLVVRDVPYLDHEGKLQIGAIVSVVVFEDNDQIRLHDHQVLWCGSRPHGIDGQPIPHLGGSEMQPGQVTFRDKELVVTRSFSNKPPGAPPPGFPNFFDKIESYVTIISGPAMQLQATATPFTFRVDEELTTGSIFKFHDTLTTRAEIGDLAKKLGEEVVAIIGLGGSGAYILDFMVKSPVKEIRGFDHDDFHVHNGFRSPGHLDGAELRKKKAEVYQRRYENFRFGLSIQARFIDQSSSADLEGVTFAFVCVDKGSSRAAIFDLLLSMKIPFIDVGMGLYRDKGLLNGMLRVTYYSVEKGAEVRAKGLAPMTEAPDDEYRKNIQIAELNAVNAGLAVLRYKQVRGFYQDDGTPFHLVFGLGDLHTFGETSL